MTEMKLPNWLAKDIDNQKKDSFCGIDAQLAVVQHGEVERQLCWQGLASGQIHW